MDKFPFALSESHKTPASLHRTCVGDTRNRLSPERLERTPRRHATVFTPAPKAKLPKQCPAALARDPHVHSGPCLRQRAARHRCCSEGPGRPQPANAEVLLTEAINVHHQGDKVKGQQSRIPPEES